MTVAAYVDAKGALRTWLNLLTSLTGPTAIPKGFFIGDEIRSPDQGAWGILTSVGGDDRLTASASPSRARISASIRGVTAQAADNAAVAYANALRSIAGVRTTLVAGVVCHMVGDITGPLDVPGTPEPQRLVDADFYLSST
jgi:hypothetical protein